jgi:flagellar motor switch/type III secretory pathway protein FliN
MASAIAVSQSKPPEFSANSWQEVGWLPCEVTAEITARRFTFGDLLSVEIGSVVDTGVATESDVSVLVNGARVGGGKLEVESSRLGVRLTELV